MSFVSHYFDLLRKLRLPAVVLAIGFCGTLGYMYYDVNQMPERITAGGLKSAENTVVPSQRPPLPPPRELNWTLFQSARDGGAPATSDFIKKFHFAGTFFVSTPGGGEQRRAVLSVAPHSSQEIVSVGSSIGGALVKRIDADRVLLQVGDRQAELLLSFGGEDTPGKHDSKGEAGSVAGATPRKKTRFGELLATNSWRLERKPLMDYYYELLDEPERLLSVFDSFEPLYAKDGKHIKGYHITVKGEDKFFKEIGLKEGDIIRKVNSLPMTNRRRAEFFIKQVVANKLNAVVIDLERDGKRKRLVYQIR